MISPQTARTCFFVLYSRSLVEHREYPELDNGADRLLNIARDVMNESSDSGRFFLSDAEAPDFLSSLCSAESPGKAELKKTVKEIVQRNAAELCDILSQFFLAEISSLHIPSVEDTIRALH